MSSRQSHTLAYTLQKYTSRLQLQVSGFVAPSHEAAAAAQLVAFDEQHRVEAMQRKLGAAADHLGETTKGLVDLAQNSVNAPLLATRGSAFLHGSLSADAGNDRETIGALKDLRKAPSLLPSHGRHSETVCGGSLSRVATFAAALAAVLLVVLCVRRLGSPMFPRTAARSLAAAGGDEAARACGGSSDGKDDEDIDEDSSGSENEDQGRTCSSSSPRVSVYPIKR
ncbi:hypothetical protein Efla_007361 [Eimeria flavescens]